MAPSVDTSTTTGVSPIDTMPSLLEADTKEKLPTDTLQDPHLQPQPGQDLEANKSTDNENTTNPKDPNLVAWDGPDDPEHPRNWPRKIKWQYTIAVSLFVLNSPISSAMIAPALGDMAQDLHMKSDVEVKLGLSIFILAYAVGPLLMGPFSELYGRVRLLQVTNIWYFAWNLGCGFAKNSPQLFVFRFLAGLGGSAPLALGGGAISDIWSADERGRAMALYAMGPMLGPALGPVAGGFIAQYTTWRWVFWSTSILAITVQVAGILWFRESHPGTLLKRKRDRLVKETGNKELHVDEKVETLGSNMRQALIRPVKLFTTQPIVTAISIYIAFIFGVAYLIFATFPDIWTGKYGESQGIGSLNYLSTAIGCFVGLFLNFAFTDKIYKYLKSKNNGEGKPEFRVPMIMVGSVLVIVGLFWYGWSVEGHVHWIMPNIGALIYTTGQICCTQGMQTYTIDCYQTYAASAMAASTILRSLLGFAFPLFAPYLYQNLGYGWGTSVLGFISIGIGIPAPVIFWLYGPKLRGLSKYAAG